MGLMTFVSTLLIAAALNAGGAPLDGKGKATTETKKGGSASSSSSKTTHVQHITSQKGSGKNSSKGTTKNSNKASKPNANSAYAAAAPFDNSKAGLEAVEVDLITGLEKDSIEAELKKNRTWFQNYLADDFNGANASGAFEDKARLMARTLDPANVVESKTYDELIVRPYGEDVMIATGKITEKGRRNNVGYDVQRTFTHVWVNRLGQWQQVAVQESPTQLGAIPNQAAAPSEVAPSPSPADAAKR